MRYFITFLLLFLVGVIGGTSYWLISRLNFENPSEESTVSIDQKTNFFGTMLAFNTNDGLRGTKNAEDLLAYGWDRIADDTTTYSAFISAVTSAFAKNANLVKQTNFSSNRDIVGAFVWNVIEPKKGTYVWDLPDAVMLGAGQAGITQVAVIQPFAVWDQENNTTANFSQCKAIDFGYYNNLAGPPTDWDAYRNFLTATVERYDGDGIDDMPGLQTRVEAWEIGNEYEGPCGGYYQNPSGYIELLKISYETIKATDPTALVLNAGALEIGGFGSGPEVTKQFWRDFFEKGGDRYLDIFNFHYNRERIGALDSSDSWEEHLVFFKDHLKKSDGEKPMWVTEFGTYAGTPSTQSPPNTNIHQQRPLLPTQSESFQAAWYFRYSIIGFAEGVERIFIGLQGGSEGGMGGVGGSSLFNQGPGVDGQARAFLQTLQGLASILEGFDHVEKKADGQYLFSVSEKKIYALWEGSLPEALAGKTLYVMGIDGVISIHDATSLVFNEFSPILAWVK